ncbi:MAG: hypothetical protein M1155_00265 [Patescibacteria group bacterium]|nr:hypothetical protein [Patescibacteria group bacterium]
MSLNFYKKIVVGLVLTSLLFGPGLFMPKKAYAVLGVGDITTTFESPMSPMAIDIAAINISTAASAGANAAVAAKAASDKTQSFLTILKQVAGQALKKLVLDRLANAAAEWIKNGGFEGKGGPIVSDWGAFFQQAGQEAVGMLAQQTLPFLCSPIKVNVALSLFSPQQQPGADVTCTLNTIVGNIDDLFKSFDKQSKGRWLTYNTLWEPQNNFFGTTLITEDKQETTLADVMKSKTIDAQISAGYKPQEQCKIDPQTHQKVCRTLTPGNQIAQSVWNTYTDTNKVAGILTADDVAGYIGALADAVIYRYSLLAMNGIAGALGYKDSDNTNTAYADYQNASFAQINSLIFKNDRTLFNSNFNTVLGIKQNTATNINQSINTESAIKTALNDFLTCDLSKAFPNGETLQISNLTSSNIISDTINNVIQPTLDGLQSELSDVQNDIAIIQSTQAQFNAMDPTDSTSEALMTKTYSNLVTNGTMDQQKATQALATSQTELSSIQNYSNSILQTNSDNGGYQDILSACANYMTPAPSTTP